MMIKLCFVKVCFGAIVNAWIGSIYWYYLCIFFFLTMLHLGRHGLGLRAFGYFCTLGTTFLGRRV